MNWHDLGQGKINLISIRVKFIKNPLGILRGSTTQAREHFASKPYSKF